MNTLSSSFEKGRRSNDGVVRNFALVAATAILAGATSVLWANGTPGTAPAALSVADRYLSAWQMRRSADGLKLLSDGLMRKSKSSQAIQDLVGLSNPHHFAYEIEDGAGTRGGKTSFKIRRFERYTGDKKSQTLPEEETITLVQVGNDWKVDEISSAMGHRKESKTVVSAEYVSALAVADRALEAWRQGQVGKPLVVPGLQVSGWSDKVQSAIKVSLGHGARAYEVSDGNRTSAGRYEFSVHLYTESAAKKPLVRAGRIVLFTSSPGKWSVAAFP